MPNHLIGGGSSTGPSTIPKMNPTSIRIAAEVALVLGTAGLLLELIQSHSWAVILIAVAALLWLQIRRH
jgi:hypothetical protein